MIQHYVPRVHLKNFAEKRGSEYYVDVYDKEKQKYFNTNISNICAQKNFYTLDNDNKVAKDILAIEKIYGGALEPMYEKAYNILTNDNILQISDLERVEILLSIFQLYMRNPRILTVSINQHNQNIRNLCIQARLENKKGITYLDEDFSFREYSEEEIKNYFKEQTIRVFKEGHIKSTGQMGTFHEFSKFEITKIVDDSNYFTSDNPLVVDDVIAHDNHPFLKSNEFIIALNSKYLVRIYHDNRIDLNKLKRTYGKRGNTGVFNHSIFQQASRFIVGTRKAIEDFFSIRDFLENKSIDVKIDLMRQIVEKFEITSETADLAELFQKYIEKYDKNGNLTVDEEQEFYRTFQQLTFKSRAEQL